MIDGRNLSLTLTVTEVNDTERYVIYEFDPQGISYSTAGGYLQLLPTNVYASPLVSATGFSSSTPDVCVSFDLFRGVKTLQETGLNSASGNLYDFTQSSYDGAVVDYVVKRTDSSGTRTGSVFIAWNSSNSTFADQSSRDAGVSTAGFTFRITADGTTATLGYNISTGTYTVTLSIRPLGTHM